MEEGSCVNMLLMLVIYIVVLVFDWIVEYGGLVVMVVVSWCKV